MIQRVRVSVKRGTGRFVWGVSGRYSGVIEIEGVELRYTESTRG